ncbi:uncharacterized protein TRIADDRAFT_32984, partial [Trichoplax adhaerens]
ASDKIIGYWLLGCSGLVFGAVILGGITRLTESGLSMVRWHIIKGMKPPSCHEEWLKEFETYKLYPEYKFSKHNITLEEFKRIFYMEYLHRMWGRLIGVAFAVPAVYFLSRGRISKAMKPRLAIYFSLLVFQGLLGWHMVKSGLVEDNRTRSIPRVSQYRLMAHLGSAFLLYAGLFWSGLSYLIKPKQLSESPKLKALRILSHGNLGIIFTTVLAVGAIVAGLDAGLVYNSFPKMAGKWIPEDIMAISPKWRNFTENSTTAQFTHRVLGLTTLTSIFGLWCFARPLTLPRRARLATNCLLAMSGVQVSLGITTLLYYVPTPLAASHQAGSLLLFTNALWLAYELRKMKF